MFSFNNNVTAGLKSHNFQHLQNQEEIKIDFTCLLPKEIIFEIFFYLNSHELTRCLGINKSWKVLASDKALWNALPFPKIAFGKKHWMKYFGEVGKEPPLPKDIYKILVSPCPFWPGKKIEDTHLLVLIPETINGKRLSLTILKELVKTPKQGLATQFCWILRHIAEEYENESVAKSQWVLITKELIPFSKNKNDTEQQNLLSNLVKQTGINYEFPNLLNILICIFMNHINSGEYLFKTHYTRCQEKIHNYPIVVGIFQSDGLQVNHMGKFASAITGVAAQRKLL